jgi:hypothetical protein
LVPTQGGSSSFFLSTQLPTPQIYLDDAGIYPALFEQPCACGAASRELFLLSLTLPPHPVQLFDFNDLHEFSLTFKSGFYWQNDGTSRGEKFRFKFLMMVGKQLTSGVGQSLTDEHERYEPVPGYHRLWDMLIKRCPNLEHLAIDGHSPHAPVDAHDLVRGRWPKLRSLLVGDVVLDWHVELNPALGRPFRTFLDAHRNLEALHLQSHAPSVAAPSVLADLHADALAKVSTFSGALVQAQVLPARASLKTLRVPDALVLREGTPLNVSASLAALPALASLTIAFRLEQGYDNGTVLRAIVLACPHLRHLDLTIACRPSFTIVSASSLPSLPPSRSPEESLFIWCSSQPRTPSRGAFVPSANCARSPCASCPPQAKTTSAHAAPASCARAHG